MKSEPSLFDVVALVSQIKSTHQKLNKDKSRVGNDEKIVILPDSDVTCTMTRSSTMQDSVDGKLGQQHADFLNIPDSTVVKDVCPATPETWASS